LSKSSHFIQLPKGQLMTTNHNQDNFNSLELLFNQHKLNKSYLEHNLRKKLISEYEFVYWMKKIGRPNEVPYYLQIKHLA
jgi:hypothetical protein